MATDIFGGELVETVPTGRDAFGGEVFGAVRPATGRVAQDITESFYAGMQDTGIGRLSRGGAEPDYQVDADSPWYHRLARGVGGIVADAPAMVAGAVIGNMVTGGRGGLIASFAGANALPMALREGVVTAYNHDAAMSWQGVLDIAAATAKGGAKGAVIGAATGLAGAGVLGKFKGGLSAPAKGAVSAPLGLTAKATVAEYGALMASSAIVEQHIPTWQDFMDNAILLGGMKGAVGVARAMRNTFAETGRTPDQQLADAARDPTIAAELKGERPKPVYTATPEGPTLKRGSVSIEEPKKYDTMGQTVYHESTVKIEGKDTGVVSLGWIDGEVATIENIRTFDGLRKKGFGTQVLDVILQHNDPTTELHLSNVQAGEARTWWANRGAKFYKSETGENGTITRADFERTQAARKGAGNAGQAGEGTAGQIPRAYQALALEERVKAAVADDPRPELVRQALAQSEGGAKINPSASKGLVDIEYVTSAEDARGVIRRVSEHFQKDIDAQTRGTVSTKQSAIDGLKLVADGNTVEHAVGQAFNDAQTRAIAYMLHVAANDAARVEAKYRGIPETQLSVEAKLELYAAIERVAVIGAEARGAAAEAGRALNTWRAIKRDPGLSDEAAAIVRLVERKGTFQDISAAVRTMRDPAQMAALAKHLTDPTTTAKIVEAWRAGIFSGPLTWQANVIGNVARWMIDTVEKPVAVTIFAATSKDPLSMAQWKARALSPYYGLQLAVLDGITLMAEAKRTLEARGAMEGGKEILSAARKALTQDNAKLDHHSKANTGVVGAGVDFSFGMLKLQDLPFRTVGERQATYVKAVDRAAAEGWHPKSREFTDAVAKYTQDPTAGLTPAKALEVSKAIEAAGDSAVFGEKLGPKLSMVSYAMAGTPWEFVFPARRTPANLLDWSVQHIPGANLLSSRWRADYAAGGERQANAVARVVIGTALTATAVGLIQSGALTGGGLTDKEMSRTKEGAGKQNYSVMVDDKYYSIQRIEPVAKLFMLVADLAEIMQSSKAEDREKAMSLTVLAFGNATISTTYMSGLANLLKAVIDPQRYGDTFVEGYASSLVPKIIGQPVVMADPYKREVDGALDAIAAQVPFLREKLSKRQDVWGMPMQNDRWFDVMPIATTQASQDKVRTEAMRLHVAIADAPKYIQEKGPLNPSDQRVKLTQPQRDIFKEVAGKSAMSILAPIVNAPDWDSVPDFVQAAIYRDVIEKTRKQGQYAALPADDAARAILREQIVDRIIKQTQDAQGAGDKGGRRLPFSTDGQPQDKGGRRLKIDDSNSDRRIKVEDAN